MPLISKCHFEDEFRDILHWIEQQFDADFANGLFYHLEGLTYEELITHISHYRNITNATIWDLYAVRKHSPELETIIKDFIVTLLYLLKKVRGENEIVTK